MTDEQLRYWTHWALDTCLLYGCQPETAGHVAAHFAAALTLNGRKT